MKKIILVTLLCVILTKLFSQEITKQTHKESGIQRSTVGVNGVSSVVKTSKATYVIRQSIGQASVIGTYENSSYTFRQGFQQPILEAKLVFPIRDSVLTAIVYPNPFKESVHISFDVTIIDDLVVSLFDVRANVVYSKTYPPTPFIRLDLHHIAPGYYFLKIISNKNQYSSTLVKY